MGLLSNIFSGIGKISSSYAKNVSNAAKAARNAAVNVLKVRQAAQKKVLNAAVNVAKAQQTARKAVIKNAAKTVKTVNTNTAKSIKTAQSNVSKAVQIAKANPIKTAALLTGGVGTAGVLVLANNPTIQQKANDAGNGLSSAITTAVNLRDSSYDEAFQQAANGDVVGGMVRGGVTAAVDTVLPLDLVNVGNKLATGQKVTGEDVFYAGIDAIAIGAGIFTGGLGYVAIKGGGKLLKTGVKAGAKTIKAGANIGGQNVGKLSGLAKAFKNGTATTKQSKKYVNSLVKTQTARVRAAQAAGNAAKVAAAKRGLAVATARKAAYLQGIKNTKKAGKAGSNIVKTGKSGSTIAQQTKTGSTLVERGKSTLKTALIGGGIGAALIGGSTLLGNFLTGGDDETLTDDLGLDDWGLGDTGLGDMGLGDMGLGDTGLGDDGLLGGAEDWADGVMDDMSELPVIGDVAEEIKANGLSLPVIILAVIVIGAIGFFLIKKFTKKGKKNGAPKTHKKNTKKAGHKKGAKKGAAA